MIGKSRLMVVLAVLLSAALGLSWWAGLLGKPRLRIAALLPLTGPDKAVGLGMRNAIQLAVDQANQRGGIQGRKVKLVEFDDASKPETAVAAAKRIVADSRIIATIGSYEEDGYRELRPVLGEAAVPYLPAAIPDRDLTTVGLNKFPSEYSLLPFGTAEMIPAAKHAWEVLGARSYVFTRDTSEYGLTVINHFRAAMSAYIKPLATGEELIRSDADLPALVAKIKAEAPQYVFYTGEARQAGLFLKQLREAGVTSFFQSATHEPSQQLIDLAGDKAEGALAVFPGLPAESFPEGRKFLADYAAAGFRDPPSIYGIFAYAEAQALLGALERSFMTRPSVAGALTNERFDTALGPVKFSPWFGSTYQQLAIYQVVKGRWTPIFATERGALKPFVAR